MTITKSMEFLTQKRNIPSYALDIDVELNSDIDQAIFMMDFNEETYEYGRTFTLSYYDLAEYLLEINDLSADIAQYGIYEWNGDSEDFVMPKIYEVFEHIRYLHGNDFAASFLKYKGVL